MPRHAEQRRRRQAQRTALDEPAEKLARWVVKKYAEAIGETNLTSWEAEEQRDRIKVHFAGWSRKFRRTFGLTQEGLAIALHVAKNTVVNWEAPRGPWLPTRENAERYQIFERQQYVDKFWGEGLIEYESAMGKILRGLVRKCADGYALPLADEAITVIQERLGEGLPMRIRDAHNALVATQAYAIIKGQAHPKVAEYCAVAWKVTGTQSEDSEAAAKIRFSIRNELIGNSFEARKNEPTFCNEAAELVEQCLILHREANPNVSSTLAAYNALEISCFAGDTALMQKSLDALLEREKPREAQRTIQRNAIYKAAIALIEKIVAAPQGDSE